MSISFGYASSELLSSGVSLRHLFNEDGSVAGYRVHHLDTGQGCDIYNNDLEVALYRALRVGLTLHIAHFYGINVHFK